MTEQELVVKYRSFLRSVELSGETTSKTFEEFKKDYLKATKN